jgi:hypothetical protein
MSLDDYRQSLAAAHPPAGLPLVLAGLWWEAKRDGTQAHESALAGRRPRGFLRPRLFASEGRRSGQRSLLVSPWMRRDHLNLQVDLSAEKEVTKPTARRSIAPAFIVTCPDCKHLFVAVLPYGLEIAH